MLIDFAIEVGLVFVLIAILLELDEIRRILRRTK